MPSGWQKLDDVSLNPQPSPPSSPLSPAHLSIEAPPTPPTPPTPPPLSRKLYLTVAIASLNSANLGYDLASSASVAPLLALPPWSLTDLQLSLFIGSINLTALLGVILSRTLSDSYGRVNTFTISSVIFLSSLLLQTLSHDFPLLLLGRLILGLAIGIGLSLDPIYIAEIVPPTHRGLLVSCSEIGINIGLIIGYLVGYLADPHWRTMLFAGTVMPTILLTLIKCNLLPESPRWLVANGREEEAMETLRVLQGTGGDTLANLVQEIKLSIKVEEEEYDSVSYKMMFLAPPPWLKSMLFVGVFVASIQQLSGVDGLQYYQHFLLAESGVKSERAQFRWSLVFSLVKTAAVIFASFKLDTLGRRFALLLSLTLTSLGLVLISLPLLFSAPPAIAVLGIALYFTGFSAGLGPACWLVPSEIFPTKIRAKGMSVCTFSNRACATIIASTVLPLSYLLTPGGYYILLLFVNIAALGGVYKWVPETKGKSLEEMMGFFDSFSQRSRAHVKIPLDDDCEEEEEARSEGFEINDNDL